MAFPGAARLHWFKQWATDLQQDNQTREDDVLKAHRMTKRKLVAQHVWPGVRVFKSYFLTLRSLGKQSAGWVLRNLRKSYRRVFSFFLRYPVPHVHTSKHLSFSVILILPWTSITTGRICIKSRSHTHRGTTIIAHWVIAQDKDATCIHCVVTTPVHSSSGIKWPLPFLSTGGASSARLKRINKKIPKRFSICLLA